MVRALASHARGRRFESYCLYQSGSLGGRKIKGTVIAVPFSFASFSFATLFLQQCGSRNNVALRFAYPALRFGTSPTVSTIMKR